MARILYPVQSPASMDWSDSTWALTDGGTADEPKPEDDDTVYFTANSGDVTVDETAPLTGALTVLNMTNYTGTLDLGTYTLTVDGMCQLYGTIIGTGTIDAGESLFNQVAAVADAVTLLLTTSGSHSIYWLGTGGSININCAGTWTLRNNISAYVFTMRRGTLDGHSQMITLTVKGAHAHGGTIKNLAQDVANPIYRFGSVDDENNGAGVIQMPSPISGAAAAMAA